ncbi:hypothetical protein IQ07DRAFT_647672 [Pyrenochaeta sp. DS3sAY3a]|nr:hypothetical protein IQ07DRAFT_647672 [Pyrenochaeta sp. DS3sAY3a]
MALANMLLILVLGGFSLVYAQSVSPSSSIQISSQPALSSSVNLSSRNGFSSVIVAPTPTTLSPSVGPSTSAQIPLSSSASWNSSSTIFNTSSPAATYENPWAGNYSSPVPPHGTGSAYALQCQNAWFSFTSINTDYLSATMSRFYMTSTIRSETVYEIHTYYETSYYTLCDGHPRVITSTPTTTLTTTLLPLTTTFLAQGLDVVKYPNPNCTVSWDDCQGLWARYHSASNIYNSISFSLANTVVQLGPGASYWMVNGITTTFPKPSPAEISLGTEYIHKYYQSGKYLIVTNPPPGGLVCDCGHTMTAGGPPVTIQNTIDFTNTPYTPSCRTEKPTCTANQRCQISGDRVEIFWFPPQNNATRDMCATAPANGPITSRPPTNFTWTPISTGPYAVLPGNTTWFSGNVYVSLNRINGMCNWSGTSVEVGSTHHGEILTMAPSELFSQRAFLTNIGDRSGMVDFEPHAYSFNFDDLVSPYPWSAWNAAFDCVKTKCSTISGAYNPWIAVPEAIRRLDPQWATCDLALYGLYDPPIALSTVGNMFLTSALPPQNGPQPTPGQSPPPGNADPTHTPINPVSPWPWQTGPVVIPPAPGPDRPGQNPQPGNPPTPDDPTQPAPPRPGVTPAPVFPSPTTIGTIDSTPIVVDPARPTQVTIGTTVLTPGAPGITVGPGTSVSLQDPGHIIISPPGAPAPSTINVPRPIGSGAPVPTAGVIITLPNGDRVTATAILGEGPGGTGTATSILVSGTLFSEGGPPITLPGGIVLSEAPAGTGIVVVDPSSGATSTLPFSDVPGIYTPDTTPAPTALVTIGGTVYTAVSRGGSVVIPELGITVTSGGAPVTVSGTVVSDAGGGTVVVGTTTEGFRGPRETGTGTGVAAATGGAVRVRGFDTFEDGKEAIILEMKSTSKPT